MFGRHIPEDFVTEPDLLKKLPTYLFVEIDKKKREAQAKGKDIIDLGIGDPDLPTPAFIIDALERAARDPANHRYPSNQGLRVLREAIATWYKERFHVALDPDEEILPLIGSKEGIAHAPLALVNPDDLVLIPDPCYPPYYSGTLMAGAEPYRMPLVAANEFLPDFGALDRSTKQRASLLFINYPGNPTGACATRDFFDEAVNFAVENRIMVAHDAAYTEIYFDNMPPPSFLEAKGAKEVGIEFHSLSKTFNMTGWRIGFAVGNRKMIRCLAQLKGHFDSGVFQAIQLAAVEALKKGGPSAAENRHVFEERRDVLVNGLRKIGWDVPMPKATFYVWLPVPPGYTSAELCMKLLEGAGVVATPGVGFGPNGEGYIRMTITVPVARLEEAVKRVKALHG
ncbi:MAG: LL-diaminopimelate aminotransferase [Candidatus Omnitrophica bacterium]|nr:LL-diaminopimelate aminotransferase [Candidatus Omnitrophota bacterium]